MPLNLPLKGGCQCGQVRYEITAMPQTLYCCHCTECQAQSASAFGMSLRVASETVKLHGATSKYVRDHGRKTEVECLFCSYGGGGGGGGRDSLAANYSIKAGSLDEPLTPVGHIWVKSKPDWLELPDGDPQYETQPDDQYAALIEAFATKYG